MVFGIWICVHLIFPFGVVHEAQKAGAGTASSPVDGGAKVEQRDEAVGEDVLPTLVHALSDPRPDVRERAAFALRHIHKEPRLTVPALIVALDDPTEMVRVWAIIGLQHFKTDAAGAVPTLRIALRTATGGAQQAAAMALIDIDPRAAKESGAYEIAGYPPPP